MTPEEKFARDCAVELRQIKSQFTIIGRAQRRFYYDVLVDGEEWGRLVPSATERFYYLHDAAGPVLSRSKLKTAKIKSIAVSHDRIRQFIATGLLKPPAEVSKLEAERQLRDRENEAARQRERRETEIALRIGRRHKDIRDLLERGLAGQSYHIITTQVERVLKILDDETAIPVADPAKVS